MNLNGFILVLVNHTNKRMRKSFQVGLQIDAPSRTSSPLPSTVGLEMSISNLQLPKPLTLEEKKYLLAVERGDMANVRRYAQFTQPLMMPTTFILFNVILLFFNHFYCQKKKHTQNTSTSLSQTPH